MVQIKSLNSLIKSIFLFILQAFLGKTKTNERFKLIGLVGLNFVLYKHKKWAMEMQEYQDLCHKNVDNKLVKFIK